MRRFMKTSSKPSKSTFSNETEQVLRDLASRLVEAKKETDGILSKFQQPIVMEDAQTRIENILSKFHLVVRQITERHENRPTLPVNDEYDVQDLLHGLLRLCFEDIRTEEWTPDYAGSSTRMDFLLKQEKTAIEVKKTRKGLSKKELGNQLVIDIAHYQKHSDCKFLCCFIYDPEEKISNPIGFERDLSGQHDNLMVKVLIVPKRA